MTLSVFPDINVWLALASPAHTHHVVARTWIHKHDVSEMAFCRFTQLGFLRLLTTAAVMRDEAMTQEQAWLAYDRFLAAGVRFVHEPPTLDGKFRSLSRAANSSPKEWADAYLAAFALEADLQLATFDKALAVRSNGILLT